MFGTKVVEKNIAKRAYNGIVKDRLFSIPGSFSFTQEPNFGSSGLKKFPSSPSSVKDRFHCTVKVCVI